MTDTDATRSPDRRTELSQNRNSGWLVLPEPAGSNPGSATNDSCDWLNVRFRGWRHSSLCCIAVTPSPEVGRINQISTPRTKITNQRPVMTCDRR